MSAMTETRRSGRLGIGIIGAGRVGAVLGAALGGAGHAIVGASAVSEASRDRLETLLPGVPVLDVPEVVRRAELVLVAVPGSELTALVEGLAAVGAWQLGQLVVHTSPRYGYGVLAPAQRVGAIPLAIHPAMAFTGTSIDLSRLHESWCAVSAPTAVQPIGQALVVEMGSEPLIVEEVDRPAYAEAIETATSFSTAIVQQAAALLRGIGVDRPGRILGPLVRSSVENALATPDRVDGSLAAPDEDGPGGVDPEDP